MHIRLLAHQDMWGNTWRNTKTHLGVDAAQPRNRRPKPCRLAVAGFVHWEHCHAAAGVAGRQQQSIASSVICARQQVVVGLRWAACNGDRLGCICKRLAGVLNICQCALAACRGMATSHSAVLPSQH
jgi:hypothetical protein